MQLLIDAGLLVLSYIIGSIPFGLVIVKLATGKDIRQVASGRTGGTNAMRAAGCWAGIATAVFDILKGASAVWITQAVTHNAWMDILAPIAAVLGHNYSIFLVERNADGGIRLRGGAGGAPAAGGAIGLWWPALFAFPVPLFMFFGVGYASLATISISLAVIVVFAVRYLMGYDPAWQHILYGVAVFFILVWALRPNLKALMEGRERFHGWRPWRKKDPDAKPE
jgi:acyl phosphate:glycerol-3-phosphate acyltransferase